MDFVALKSKDKYFYKMEKTKASAHAHFASSKAIDHSIYFAWPNGFSDTQLKFSL